MNDFKRESFQNSKLKIKKNRRIFLLDKAQTVFLEKGYDESTVNDVLVEANLSKGGFYHYFKSKSDLLDALRSRYTNEFIAALNTKIANVEDGDMENKFRLWIYAYIELYLASYAVHDLVYHSVHSCRTSEDRLQIIQNLENLLIEGINKKSWNMSSPQLIATIIYSAIHGVSDDTIERKSGDLSQIKETLYKYLRVLLQ